MNSVPERRPDWVKPDGSRIDTLRTRALEVATELVATRGPDHVNVRDIAELLQTGPSSLYYYFKSKDALLAEVAAEGFRSLEAKVRASRADPQRPRPRCYLRWCHRWRGSRRVWRVWRVRRVRRGGPR